MDRRQYLAPYVNFQGRAREALEFYQKVLGGTLDAKNLRLETEGTTLIATDGSPDYPAKAGENMALAVGGTDKDRLTKIFNALAEDGKIKAPLAEQWGAHVGWLTDKFGINWMVSVDKA